jgi:hypothetical protein
MADKLDDLPAPCSLPTVGSEPTLSCHPQWEGRIYTWEQCPINVKLYQDTLDTFFSLHVQHAFNISELCPVSIRTRNQDANVLILFIEEPNLAVLFLVGVFLSHKAHKRHLTESEDSYLSHFVSEYPIN